MHNNEIYALAGLAVSAAHFLLNLICKTTEMDCQPIEQLPLRAVQGEVSDQGAFGRVPTKLFERRPIRPIAAS